MIVTLTILFKSKAYSVLWIIAGMCLILSSIFLILSCNFFSWSLDFDLSTLLSALAVFVSLGFIIWLSINTKSKSAVIVSFVTCIALSAIGISHYTLFHQEVLSTSFFGRSILSPEWFRIAILAIHCMPFIAWFGWPCRRRIISKNNISADSSSCYFSNNVEN